MAIRRAVQTDAHALTELMMMAMGDIVFQFIGLDPTQKSDINYQKAFAFLKDFVVQDNNQYSYQNCWIYEVDHSIVGMANVYDGSSLEYLRDPILDKITHHYKTYATLENETEAGEFYIDTIAVYPSYRGKGLGENLLLSLIQHFVHENKKVLGLLVDANNEPAKKLYLKVGFQFIQYKTLVGNSLAHLQYHPTHE